ncbi:MAG: hypothetical protein M1363_03045 [Gammaproteobacteria bacterium]|nr:hypothetical protein [Gammaproteobacteria bacterium]
MDDFDIRPYLVDVTDMDFFEDDAELAADHLNLMLYTIVQHTADIEFWTFEKREQLILEISELWLREPGLVEAESDELEDYITHLVQRIEQDDQATENDEG